MKAKLIRADGYEEDIVLSEDDNLRYQKVSEYVGGAVMQYTLKSGKKMYLNEDGKLHNMDINLKATTLARGNIMPNEYVLGNVVVV